MEITYVPGVGTALMQNREQQGVTVPDKGFADLLWASFFSSETCCSGLKKQILEHCSRERFTGSIRGQETTIVQYVAEPSEADACPLDYCVTLSLRNSLPVDPQSR